MGGECACQGVGIGIVMHIKRRQRVCCDAARVQVDIAFLTACRIDFLLELRSAECTLEKGERQYLSIRKR